MAEGLTNWRVAVNGSYAQKVCRLSDGDEVAIIPPVSGGTDEDTDFVQLTIDPIDLGPLIGLVAKPNCGAVVLFLGTVRNENFGRRVLSVTYEAYEKMAVQELKRIADEIRQKWTIGRIAIVHRTGKLTVGEVSVAIVVSAPHRHEAFEAARTAIERIKEIVPIWKQEEYASGERKWLLGSVDQQSER